MSDNKVPFIKASAKVTVEFGTDFINRIQNVYSYLLEGKTKEDVDALRATIDAKGPLTSWQMSVVTMTSLVSTIHKISRDTDQVDYRELEDSLS